MHEDKICYLEIKSKSIPCPSNVLILYILLQCFLNEIFFGCLNAKVELQFLNQYLIQHFFKKFLFIPSLTFPTFHMSAHVSLACPQIAIIRKQLLFRLFQLSFLIYGILVNIISDNFRNSLPPLKKCSCFLLTICSDLWLSPSGRRCRVNSPHRQYLHACFLYSWTTADYPAQGWGSGKNRLPPPRYSGSRSGTTTPSFDQLFSPLSLIN